jgi:hypothetical protein
MVHCNACDGLEDLEKARVLDAHLLTLSGSPEGWNVS